MTNVSDGGYIRIALGELDDSEFRFRQRESAWTDYLHIAAEVEPEVITTLLTDEILDAWAAYIASQREGGLGAAYGPIDAHIQAWSERWGFIRDRVDGAAFRLLDAAHNARCAGQPLPTTFVSDSLGNTTSLPPDAYHVKLFGRPMAPRLGLKLPEFFWEPTTETFNDALGRIMASIEQIVRAELGLIRKDYLSRGYQSSIRKRDRGKHFQWLARRRLLKETVVSIANSLDADTETRRDLRTVQRGIGKAADSLGLPRRISKRPANRH